MFLFVLHTLGAEALCIMTMKKYSVQNEYSTLDRELLR